AAEAASASVALPMDDLAYGCFRNSGNHPPASGPLRWTWGRSSDFADAGGNRPRLSFPRKPGPINTGRLNIAPAFAGATCKGAEPLGGDWGPALAFAPKPPAATRKVLSATSSASIRVHLRSQTRFSAGHGVHRSDSPPG